MLPEQTAVHIIKNLAKYLSSKARPVRAFLRLCGQAWLGATVTKVRL